LSSAKKLLRGAYLSGKSSNRRLCRENAAAPGGAGLGLYFNALRATEVGPLIRRGASVAEASQRAGV
jgi:hypothetical protein